MHARPSASDTKGFIVAVYKRKTDNERRGRPPTAKDEVTSLLLATGQATMAQIAQLFNTDAKTLPKRMKGVVPKGKRSGYTVYDIAEAASMIVRPGYEIEDFIRQMSPQELSPLLTKEFWNGQNARLNFEKNMGMHWPTEDVVAAFGELVNVVRMTALLVADDVERESGLTDAQRLIIRRIMDAMVTTLRQNIEEKFKDYHANRVLAPPSALMEVQEEPEDGNLLAEDEDEDDNILAAEDDEEEDDGI
jgi:hypothetical protein